MIFGATILSGVSDWQIFQQENGLARITIEGSWYTKSEYTQACVYVCVKNEDTGEPIVWWTPCKMSDVVWEITLALPAGGLYRIETTLVLNQNHWSEWGLRGDIRSHIGVGDLFVIAGQSNSSGYGKDYIYDPPELGVSILKNNGCWELASHPLQDSTGCRDEPANCDYANTSHSMYLSFAKYMKRVLGYPIGLIQTAKGGTALSEWNPEQGKLYANMVDRIRLSGGKIRALIWYQGCSDATAELANQYKENFMHFYYELSAALSANELPVFVFQLNRCIANRQNDSDENWGTVREQQRQLGKEKNIIVIPTSDSPISDAFGHNTAKANMTLGERLAKSALTHLYGKNYMCDAPELICAKKAGDDKVRLSFRNVYDKLDTFDADAKDVDFAVIDDCGINPVLKCEVVDRNQILLTLERKIAKHGMIHGGYEMNLPRVIPFDYATHIPMLSFYGQSIEE